ncbi:hypothetical protein [Bacillus phage CP-51]|uniref:Uncharacterized protein n=1 Tax=Bacillus phage CP-51 TaxID=1391188 RepID=A0A068EMK5_9CAUD|nr:hypothetical protein OZ73_gp203 [Bacillus phage CP-51]AID50638.1 hypothetical protein [Bacillus phage CP-51]
MQVVKPEVEPNNTLIEAGSIIVENGGFGATYLVTEHVVYESTNHVGQTVDGTLLQNLNGTSGHLIKNNIAPISYEAVQGALGSTFDVFTAEEYLLQLVKK